ncbi:energy transducer TonB [Pedobacter sp. MC2016-24]|uniref:energy transducer TonB n=1 Tax=Pedobacter sp. MC2016-24 TaxID=2780090 RepID=UPI00187F3196|nr:energy transducer TonB [Pedobacter sp. MC2016-24]MBE9598216.1 energy transducer TonB [Pedobacter sp. MC2016-24]
MLGSKIDLFGNEWLDVVFDAKNKNYGAYTLRRDSSSNTAKALLLAGTAFILLFLSPKIIQLVRGSQDIEDAVSTQSVVTVQSPPAVNPETPPPAAVEPPPSKQNITKFLPPVVVENPRDPEPVSIKELENSNPGAKTVEGTDDGQIVIEGPTGKGPVGARATEDSHVYDVFSALEVQPTFPGGMDKFYAYLSKSIRYPAAAQEINIQGKVFVSFIIERNGKLSDIKVERKLGYGTDEEAIRVLNASPRWIPGIQNGIAVRVKYNIPISFSLAQ